MQLVSLNKEKIKEATNASQTATVTMIMLGMRERARSTTNLLSVKTQLEKMREKVSNKDYMNFWRALEEAGAGALILGRRGGQTRFQWNYSLRQIAQLAIEGKEADIKRFELKKQVVEAPKVLQPRVLEPKVEVKMITRSVELRPGCSAQITLPDNLTAEELVKVTRGLMIG